MFTFSDEEACNLKLVYWNKFSRSKAATEYRFHRQTIRFAIVVGKTLQRCL